MFNEAKRQERICYRGKTFEKDEGYSDLVTFTYHLGESDSAPYFYCTFKFTYHPERKEWSNKLIGSRSEMETIESALGMERSEFPLLMRKRQDDYFTAREVFYERFYALINKQKVDLEIRKLTPHANNKSCSVTTRCLKSNLELVFVFREFAKISHIVVQEINTTTPQNYMNIPGNASFPWIEEIRRYLCEESEYRMKLLTLG